MGVLVFNTAPTQSSEDYVEMLGSPRLDIPALFISQESGQQVLQELAVGPVSAAIKSDDRLYGSGTSEGVHLFTSSDGSNSASHWDLSRFGSDVFPTPLLMAGAPTGSTELDLTPAVMAELGWSVVRGLGVAVVKALSAEATVGGDTKFLVAAVNHRSTPIDAVALALTLPPKTTFVSNQGACSGALPCGLGRMEPGEARLVITTLHVDPSASAPLTVTAQLTPSSANAGDSLTGSVTAPTATGGDVRVSVTPPPSATPGANATFHVLVANDGPGSSTDVSLSADTGGLALAQGTTTACGKGFPCGFGTLAAGTQQAFDVVVRIPTGFSGTATVSASVTSSTPDSNPANNASSASALVAGGGGGAAASKSGCSATATPRGPGDCSPSSPLGSCDPGEASRASRSHAPFPASSSCSGASTA